jgi:hypothetical protein
MHGISHNQIIYTSGRTRIENSRSCRRIDVIFRVLLSDKLEGLTGLLYLCCGRVTMVYLRKYDVKGGLLKVGQAFRQPG